MRLRMTVWLTHTKSVLLSAIVGGPAMCLYMWFINSSVEFENMLITLPLQSLWISMVVLLMGGMSLYRTYLPLAIGFGSTRKEAEIGLNLMKAINILGVFAAVCIYALIFGKEMNEYFFRFIPTGLGALVLVDSVGSLLGIAMHRFGAKGGIVVAITAFVVGASCGLLGTQGFKLWWTELTILNYLVPAIAAVVLAVQLITQHLILRTYAVRF